MVSFQNLTTGIRISLETDSDRTFDLNFDGISGKHPSSSTTQKQYFQTLYMFQYFFYSLRYIIDTAHTVNP